MNVVQKFDPNQVANATMWMNAPHLGDIAFEEVAAMATTAQMARKRKEFLLWAAGSTQFVGSQLVRPSLLRPSLLLVSDAVAEALSKREPRPTPLLAEEADRAAVGFMAEEIRSRLGTTGATDAL